MSDELMGDEVYQPQPQDSGEVQDDVAVLDPQDTLDNRGVDPAIDEGYSPPERPIEVRTGITATEQRRGESLDQRLSEEEPEITLPDWDGIGDLAGGDGEPLDSEVGDARAGRLISYDEGVPRDPDDVDDRLAFDAGIAGGAASAEEAAVHVIEAPGIERL